MFQAPINGPRPSARWNEGDLGCVTTKFGRAREIGGK
jgi:hypothetical protein